MYKRIARASILLLIFGAATLGIFYIGFQLIDPAVIFPADGILDSLDARDRQSVFFWSIAIYLFLLWKSSGIVINDLFWLLRDRKHEQDDGEE